MVSTQYLTISVDNDDIFQTVYAKQGDYGGREFIITMLRNNQQIVPSSGDTAKFRFRKPNEESAWVNAVINNNGTIKVVTNQNMLLLPGVIYCDVAIIRSNNVLSTATFMIYCEEAPMNAHSAISSDEFLLLQQTIIEAIDSINSVKNMITSAHGLAAGSSPTAVVTGGEDGDPLSISFGIPKGDKGDTYDLTQTDKQDIANIIGYETELRYILNGTSNPSSSLGSNGDVYVRYVP